MFVCVSFSTGYLNCFRVKWPWRSTWHMCQVISCSYFSQSALRNGCPNRNPFWCIQSNISFVILYETSWNFVIMFGYMWTIALTKIWNRNKIYYRRYSVVLIIKWISIWQLVPVLFRVSRSSGCQNLNPGRKSWKWPRPETAVPT
jgi:hypothetical protein